MSYSRYPESATDVDAAVVGEEGRVAVSCRHLSDDNTSEVDEQRVITEIIIVKHVASQGQVVVTAERVHLPATTGHNK